MQRMTMGLVTGALLLASGSALAGPAGGQRGAQGSEQANRQATASRQSPTMMGSGVAQFTLPPQPQPAAITPSGELVPAASATSDAPPSARDSKFLLRANLGVSALRMSSQYYDRDGAKATAAELSVDVGARLHELFGIAGHAGVLAGLSWEEAYWHDIDDDVAYYRASATPLELGAALHFFLNQRAWVSPWAGVVALGRAGGTQRALGVSGGVDVLTTDTGHRLGIYAQGLRTEGYAENEDGLRAYSLGATYSFR